MVYCFAVECQNDSRKTKGISYHQFPKDRMVCKEWLAKISRENAKITKDSVVCSEHFTPDCFQRNLKAELMGTKSKTRLKPGAVPTIFSHRPPPKKPRLSSEKRTKEKEKKEVRTNLANYASHDVTGVLSQSLYFHWFKTIS